MFACALVLPVGTSSRTDRPFAAVRCSYVEGQLLVFTGGERADFLAVRIKVPSVYLLAYLSNCVQVALNL